MVMWMNELPKGWIKIPLTDCIYFQEGPGLRKYQFADSGIPFLNIRTFENGRINKSRCQHILKSEFSNKYEHFLLDEGDIVVSSSGSLGKVAVIHKEDLPVMLNTSIIRYRSLSPQFLSQHFLKYFLQSQHFYIQIDSAKTGSAILNYGPSHLKTMSIIVPPIIEQKGIVEKLDKLLSRVNTAKTRLDKIPQTIKRFRQSILTAAVSGELTKDWRLMNQIKGNWTEITLDKLVPKGGVFDGPFGSHLKTNDYVEKGVRVIRLENIGHLKFNSEKYRYISNTKYETLKKHTVYENDIVFSSFIADEIRACKLVDLNETAIAKADCFCIRPLEKIIIKDYLLLQLVSDKSYNQLIKNIHGATRPRINLSQLKKLSIGICSLDEQKEIIRRVEQLFKFADQIDIRYNKAKHYVDKLTQSILAKAFRGELLPQDPTDEPPSVLLKKVNEQKQLITNKSIKKCIEWETE